MTCKSNVIILNKIDLGETDLLAQVVNQGNDNEYEIHIEEWDGGYRIFPCKQDSRLLAQVDSNDSSLKYIITGSIDYSTRISIDFSGSMSIPEALQIIIDSLKRHIADVEERGLLVISPYPKAAYFK